MTCEEMKVEDNKESVCGVCVCVCVCGVCVCVCVCVECVCVYYIYLIVNSITELSKQSYVLHFIE